MTIVSPSRRYQIHGLAGSTVSHPWSATDRVARLGEKGADVVGQGGGDG